MLGEMANNIDHYQTAALVAAVQFVLCLHLNCFYQMKL